MTDYRDYDNLVERLSEYRRQIKQLRLDHFAPDEFIRLGAKDWPDLYPPPPWLWPHIEKTARLADRIRDFWGKPVQVVSGYRPPRYNDIELDSDTSEKSMHMRFAALDLKPVGQFDIERWVGEVERVVGEARQRDSHAIGLGRYWNGRGRFCHIDTGYHTGDRDWTIGEDLRCKNDTPQPS
jgi:hypothetical protein